MQSIVTWILDMATELLVFGRVKELCFNCLPTPHILNLNPSAKKANHLSFCFKDVYAKLSQPSTSEVDTLKHYEYRLHCLIVLFRHLHSVSLT